MNRLLESPILSKKSIQRAYRAAVALAKTNGCDPRNDDQPQWLVGRAELAELLEALHVPLRHELYEEQE